jgi:hypothetical protein
MANETTPVCELCGESMPPGEEMFKYHGYSGPCPKPPLPTVEAPCAADRHHWATTADTEGDTCNCGAWYRFADRIERTPTNDS